MSFLNIRLILLQRIFSILLTFSIFVSCTKPEQSFFTMQSGDFNKDCASLTSEQASLELQIEKYKNKQKLKVVKNFGLFLIAIFQAGLSLLFLDFKGDAEEQINILKRRIEHLKKMKEIRC